MDNIDVFVDHFVIHSESRLALIVNGSREQFESRLRELVQKEVKEILNNRVIDLEKERDQLPSAKLERRDRLTDGITTLKELHDDLDFWGEEYKKYQNLLR